MLRKFSMMRRPPALREDIQALSQLIPPQFFQKNGMHAACEDLYWHGRLRVNPSIASRYYIEDCQYLVCAAAELGLSRLFLALADQLTPAILNPVLAICYYYALQNNNTSLLAHVADLNTHDQLNMNDVFLIAAYHGDWPSMEHALTQGADPHYFSVHRIRIPGKAIICANVLWTLLQGKGNSNTTINTITQKLQTLFPHFQFCIIGQRYNGISLLHHLFNPKVYNKEYCLSAEDFATRYEIIDQWLLLAELTPSEKQTFFNSRCTLQDSVIEQPLEYAQEYFSWHDGMTSKKAFSGLEAMRWLVRNGARSEEQTPGRRKYFPLHAAVARGSLSLANLLHHQLGFRFESVNLQGNTAVDTFCGMSNYGCLGSYRGYESEADKEIMLSFILSHLSDINTTNKFGNTFLHSAAIHLSAPLIRMMMDKGMQINHADNRDISFLHLLCLNRNDDVAMIKLISDILDTGIDMNARTAKDRRHALQFAVDSLSINKFHFFLTRRAHLALSQKEIANLYKSLKMHYMLCYDAQHAYPRIQAMIGHLDAVVKPAATMPHASASTSTAATKTERPRLFTQTPPSPEEPPSERSRLLGSTSSHTEVRRGYGTKVPMR